MRLLHLWLLVILGLGCTDPEVFSIQPIPAQRALVGEELQVELVLVDLGGSVPSFSMTSPTLPDLMTRSNPPRFTVFGDRGAYLRWSPIASDVGVHQMTVTARGADHATSQTFVLEVASGDAAPVFLRQLGAGMTLDLSRDNCFRFRVEVQDTDTVSGSIQLEAPIEDGYGLIPAGDWVADFEWCPNEGQINRQTRYLLNLIADDASGHSTRKSYTLILRDTIGDNCAGRAPRIEHTAPESLPRDASIQLTVRVTDDIGIQTPPIVYYRVATPNATPDLDTFVNGNMELRTGTPKDGVYGVSIPLSFLPATSADIEYFIEVTDNDDPQGNCDHRSTSPNDGLHLLTLTPNDSTGMLSVCDSCAADGDCLSGFCALQPDDTGVCLDRCQMGVSADACDSLPRGACCGETLVECSGQTINGSGLIQTPCNGPCGWNADNGRYSCRPSHPADPSGLFPNNCPESGGCAVGYACSSDAQTSMSGQSSTVCQPNGGSCSALCVDDQFEPNNDVSEAFLLASPNETINDLKLCGNEQGTVYDYYNVFVPQKGELTVEARFRHTDGDLDLSIRDAQDQVVDLGFSVTDDEFIQACVDPGTYTINAFSFEPLIDIGYSLSINFEESTCCAEDIYEPNNSSDNAPLILAGTIDPVLSICRDDLDYYAIDLVVGETLIVDILFDQGDEMGDLDIFIHDFNDQRLTPCCQLDNGQSVTSDEHLEFPVMLTGRYFIVIEGYAGAQNEYLMSAEIR